MVLLGEDSTDHRHAEGALDSGAEVAEQGTDLHLAIRSFYEAEKPTAALCHGVSALIDLQLSDGSYLIEGKTITGFANFEEDFADQVVGKQVMPWRIEVAARERGANYVQGGLWKPFAIRQARPSRLVAEPPGIWQNAVARLMGERLPRRLPQRPQGSARQEPASSSVGVQLTNVIEACA